VFINKIIYIPLNSLFFVIFTKLCDTESIPRCTLSCMAVFMHFFPVKFEARLIVTIANHYSRAFTVIGYDRSRSNSIRVSWRHKCNGRF